MLLYVRCGTMLCYRIVPPVGCSGRLIIFCMVVWCVFCGGVLQVGSCMLCRLFSVGIFWRGGLV
jgi:hypothetical protein